MREIGFVSRLASPKKFATQLASAPIRADTGPGRALGVIRKGETRAEM